MANRSYAFSDIACSSVASSGSEGFTSAFLTISKYLRQRLNTWHWYMRKRPISTIIILMTRTTRSRTTKSSWWPEIKKNCPRKNSSKIHFRCLFKRFFKGKLARKWERRMEMEQRETGNCNLIAETVCNCLLYCLSHLLQKFFVSCFYLAINDVSALPEWGGNDAEHKQTSTKKWVRCSHESFCFTSFMRERIFLFAG